MRVALGHFRGPIMRFKILGPYPIFIGTTTSRPNRMGVARRRGTLRA